MMNHWMFHCKDVSRKISQAMDTRLPFPERIAVEIHLLMCRYCARFRSQLRLLREMGSQVDIDRPGSEPTVGLSTECKKRIREALRNQK